MKKIILACLAVMSLCFAELRVDTQEKKVDIGFFIGGGIGVGANAMNFLSIPDTVTGALYDKNISYASFVASIKAGIYHYFTPMIGLRGYYNLDLNVLPMDEFSVNGQSMTHYIFSASHTITADVIVNVFTLGNIDVAVIGGIVMGAVAGEFLAKNDTLFYLFNEVKSFLDFDFRFNLGARAMFDKKYGVEFMMKLPVVGTTAWKNATAQSIASAKYSPYYFTIDFVMERF